MRRLAVSLVAVAFLYVAAPASAATHHHPGIITSGAYPPTTTTTQPPPTSAIYVEPFPELIGTTFSYEECGFYPGSIGYMSFNGIHYGTVVAGLNGCYTLVIQVFDPHVTIDGGQLRPANWQDNVVFVTGTGANTATRTYTLVFNIANPTSSSQTTTTLGPGNHGPGGGGSGGGGGGTLAFTGFEALATTVAGLALLAVGTLLVFITRRRNQARHTDPTA